MAYPLRGAQRHVVLLEAAAGGVRLALLLLALVELDVGGPAVLGLVGVGEAGIEISGLQLVDFRHGCLGRRPPPPRGTQTHTKNERASAGVFFHTPLGERGSALGAQAAYTRVPERSIRGLS